MRNWQQKNIYIIQCSLFNIKKSDHNIWSRSRLRIKDVRHYLRVYFVNKYINEFLYLKLIEYVALYPFIYIIFSTFLQSDAFVFDKINLFTNELFLWSTGYLVYIFCHNDLSFYISVKRPFLSSNRENG